MVGGGSYPPIMPHANLSLIITCIVLPVYAMVDVKSKGGMYKPRGQMRGEGGLLR